MTGPRLWPTDAADDRDQAAEAVNEAAFRLERIRSRIPADCAIEIAQAEINLHKSLRLLERNGAKTRVARDPLRA